MRSIGKRAGLGDVHPHMLRAAFIMAALDAGVPLRDVQIAARHADPRTTTVYDRRRQNYDRHAAYAVVAFVSHQRLNNGLSPDHPIPAGDNNDPARPQTPDAWQQGWAAGVVVSGSRRRCP